MRPNQFLRRPGVQKIYAAGSESDRNQLKRSPFNGVGLLASAWRIGLATFSERFRCLDVSCASGSLLVLQRTCGERVSIVAIWVIIHDLMEPPFRALVVESPRRRFHG